MPFIPKTREELDIAIREYIIDKNKDNYGLIDTWDVSNIKVMGGLFMNYHYFNENINSWDVSNVQNMDGMFYNCKNFNQSLDKWDVSNVQYMNNMFDKCFNFNQSLDNWNVSNVKYMNFMFYDCKNFNKPLNNWNISNVKCMNYMFYNCESFNQTLNNWNISNVQNTSCMFKNCNISNSSKPGALPTIKYKDLTQTMKQDNLICPITYEDFNDESNIIKTICGHIFSKTGLEQWLELNNTCPYCMQKIKN